MYPKVEKAEYQQMFSYYSNLGIRRSLRKVAKEFNRSLQTIALVSKAFDWKNRIQTNINLTQDPFTLLVKPRVEQSRKDIVDVLCEITIILSEMTDLARVIRSDGTGDLSDAQKKKMKSLINALGVYGISVKNPKDLRDMVGTMKDVMEFNKGLGGPGGGDKPSSQILVNEMNLTIKDD
jgi:hypothetical protein